jgi:diguanylate cyclase (GGDEF)-like protein
MGWRADRVVVAGVAALAFPAALSSANWARVLLEIASAVALVVLWASPMRRRGTARSAWTFLAAGVTLLFVGDLLWDVYLLGPGTPPAVSVADVGCLAAYPLLMVGIVRMVRLRAPGGIAEARLDGVAIASAASLAAWAFMVAPKVNGTGSLVERLVFAAYPVADVVLLAALLWLVLSPGERGAPAKLMFAGLGTLLLADIASAVVPVHVAMFATPRLDPGYALVYALLAGAALHPDAGDLTRSGPPPDRRLHPARLALLGVALCAAPLVAVSSADLMSGPVKWFLVIAAFGIAMLVLTRFTIGARAHESAQDALAYQATHDELTGLVNRPLLLDRVAHALAQRRGDGNGIAILYFDLDRFKPINDTWGHRAGDAVLVEVATRVQNVLRDGDTLARVGGDEFVVLCEGVTGPGDAISIAERVLAAVSKPVQLADAPVTVGASIGIALPSPTSNTPDALVRDADAAMYRAKEHGRDRYEMYDTEMANWLMERRATETALQLAVGNGELRLVYQPVVQLSSGEVTGFEALVRWVRPGFGVVPPSEFISIAEETGMIVPIGEWVLERACEQLALWNEQNPDRAPLDVAVNVSVRQFRQPGFVSAIERVLAKTGIDPRNLLLEVTESMLLTDTDDALARLETAKSLGARIAIDDFGTGYSSLSYLRQFPFDVVKIDKAYTQDLGNGAADTTLLAGIVALTHVLGHTIVAEGAETLEQVMTLQALRCDYVQGYFFSTPLEQEVADALVRGDRNLVEQVMSRTTANAS